MTIEVCVSNAPVDADELRLTLNYCPLTGAFTRIATKRAKEYGVGKVVGAPDGSGYIKVWVSGRLRRAHRLAWLYMTSEWPDGEIDHINGDRADNRWRNLRLVDHKTNMENQRSARSDNPSKMLGVTWHKCQGRWRARITTQGKQKHLGSFDSAHEAHQCYLDAKRQIHSGCAI